MPRPAPPGHVPRKRTRPLIAFTIAPEVDAEIRKRAKKTGEKLSRLAERALRKGLGLPATAPA